MENSISNAHRSGQFHLTKSLSLSVISNKCGLLIQSSCNKVLPVWATLCVVDGRGRVIQLLVHFVALLLPQCGSNQKQKQACIGWSFTVIVSPNPNPEP